LTRDRWSGGDGDYLGFAARFGFGGFGKELLFGELPVVEGVAGGAVALEIDVLGALGVIVVGRGGLGGGRLTGLGYGVSVCRLLRHC
jgi:hypothetical protein